MGLNRRSKHIGLKFLWLQDHHKSGVIKVKSISSQENPADIFTKHVSASTLAKHLSSCGLQELRVGEGDDSTCCILHIFNLLTDTKFRKGSHQVQAQALPLQQEQEQEEEEIGNIFDIDVCMIEAEEDSTTSVPPATTTSTEKTSMQILAEVLQRKRQQQQERDKAAATAESTAAAGRAASFCANIIIL